MTEDEQMKEPALHFRFHFEGSQNKSGRLSIVLVGGFYDHLLASHHTCITKTSFNILEVFENSLTSGILQFNCIQQKMQFAQN